MIQGRQKRRNLILKLVLLSLIMLVIFLFLRQYVKIKAKKEEIQEINSQILVEESKNKEILGILNLKDSEESLAPGDNNSGATSGRTRVFESIIK